MPAEVQVPLHRRLALADGVVEFGVRVGYPLRDRGVLSSQIGRRATLVA